MRENVDPLILDDSYSSARATQSQLFVSVDM